MKLPVHQAPQASWGWGYVIPLPIAKVSPDGGNRCCLICRPPPAHQEPDSSCHLGGTDQGGALEPRGGSYCAREASLGPFSVSLFHSFSLVPPDLPLPHRNPGWGRAKVVGARLRGKKEAGERAGGARGTGAGGGAAAQRREVVAGGGGRRVRGMAEPQHLSLPGDSRFRHGSFWALTHPEDLFGFWNGPSGTSRGSN